MKDVVVVGGGISGLTAAWRLRDCDVLLLEAEKRLGGRIKSEPRGEYWVSVGAHMFPEPDSVVGGLVEELGLETLVIRGNLLGVAYGGKVITGGRVETYPLRLPMSAGGRLAFIRAGLKLRRAAARYNRLAVRQPGETPADVRARLLRFLDDCSFADYLGPLHPEAEPVFRATANRLTAEPDEIAAGCMVGLFAHVWSTGGVVLGRNLAGGASALPDELGRRLGARVLRGAEAVEVRREDGASVRVRYRKEGRLEEVWARTAIVATTAPVARRIIADLPPETARALDGIVYGPFVVGGIVTNESGPMPWDNTYSVLSVRTCFNMFFNHANVVRMPDRARQPGGTLMVYGGAGLARRLWNRSDEQIRREIVADLDRLFPGAGATVEEILVQRWEHAIPYARPGRHLLQPALEAGVGGTIFLAGDYVGEWTHMEAGAQTAVEAAARVQRLLAHPASNRS
jgi:oxygen-dependent protoporphyrinogen oxidase